MHALSAPKLFYPSFQAHCPLPFVQLECIQYNIFQLLNTNIFMLSAFRLKCWHEDMSSLMQASPRFYHSLCACWLKLLVL